MLESFVGGKAFGAQLGETISIDSAEGAEGAKPSQDKTKARLLASNTARDALQSQMGSTGGSPCSSCASEEKT